MDNTEGGIESAYELARERFAAIGVDTDAALHHIGDAGNVGAAAADQDLIGLRAAAARSEVELQ